MKGEEKKKIDFHAMTSKSCPLIMMHDKRCFRITKINGAKNTVTDLLQHILSFQTSKSVSYEK